MKNGPTVETRFAQGARVEVDSSITTPWATLDERYAEGAPERNPSGVKLRGVEGGVASEAYVSKETGQTIVPVQFEGGGVRGVPEKALRSPRARVSSAFGASAEARATWERVFGAQLRQIIRLKDRIARLERKGRRKKRRGR